MPTETQERQTDALAEAEAEMRSLLLALRDARNQGQREILEARLRTLERKRFAVTRAMLVR
jgi:hypothetical protein